MEPNFYLTFAKKFGSIFILAEKSLQKIDFMQLYIRFKIDIR